MRHSPRPATEQLRQSQVYKHSPRTTRRAPIPGTGRTNSHLKGGFLPTRRPPLSHKHVGAVDPWRRGHGRDGPTTTSQGLPGRARTGGSGRRRPVGTQTAATFPQWKRRVPLPVAARQSP